MVNPQDKQFEAHLSEWQYSELAQFWHEYMILGPRRSQEQLSLQEEALNFCEWIDADEDYPPYGIPEILAFFAEKERREGTAIKSE